MFCSALAACLAPPAQARPAAQKPANPLRQPSILKHIVTRLSDVRYFPEVSQRLQTVDLQAHPNTSLLF